MQKQTPCDFNISHVRAVNPCDAGQHPGTKNMDEPCWKNLRSTGRLICFDCRAACRCRPPARMGPNTFETISEHEKNRENEKGVVRPFSQEPISDWTKRPHCTDQPQTAALTRAELQQILFLDVRDNPIQEPRPRVYRSGRARRLARTHRSMFTSRFKGLRYTEETAL